MSLRKPGEGLPGVGTSASLTRGLGGFEPCGTHAYLAGAPPERACPHGGFLEDRLALDRRSLPPEARARKRLPPRAYGARSARRVLVGRQEGPPPRQASPHGPSLHDRGARLVGCQSRLRAVRPPLPGRLYEASLRGFDGKPCSGDGGAVSEAAAGSPVAPGGDRVGQQPAPALWQPDALPSLVARRHQAGPRVATRHGGRLSCARRGAHFPAPPLLRLSLDKTRGVTGRERAASCGVARFSRNPSPKRSAMPAKSAAQQKAAGAALSAKRGKTSPSKLKGPSKSMYQSMSE